MLEALDERAEPISIAALATVTGLHVNTLREHLDALGDAGLVRRERAPVAGRGRPAWLYSAIPDDETQGETSEYAGLASALAEVIEQSSSSPPNAGLSPETRRTPGDASCDCSTVSGSPLSRTRGTRSSG